MAKKRATKKKRPTTVLTVHVTAKDIATARREGLTGTELVARAVARRIGAPQPLRLVRPRPTKTHAR